MIRTLTPALVLLANLALAQQTLPTLERAPEHKHGPRTPERRLPQEPNEARGTAFYSETFDSDLNGWTALTEQGQVDWKWTNTGPGPTTSTYPVPPLNTSTPSGWAIIDDDFDGVSGSSTNASLISPVIDLSGVGTTFLKVEFDQYFQEFQLDQTFVGVSTDGGVTWNESEINIEVGRDGRPNPELVDVNISDWIAADPANVQLRFRYVSTWDYGWQIDNIAIRELPANDMALLRAINTAYDFTNTEFNFMDYTIYPLSQVASLSPRAVVKNKGYASQNNVVLTLDVTGPGGAEGSSATTPTAYTSGTETQVVIPDLTPSGAYGNYTLTYTVDQDETDEVPGNNVVLSNLQVSPDIYAHDDGSTEGGISQGPTTADAAYEVGHHFVLVQNNQLFGVQVAVHESTPVGSTVYGAIYFPSSGATNHPEIIELTDDYTVTEADLNGTGEANFITMLFSTPIPLDAGQPYLLMAGTFDGAAGVQFAYSGVSEAQVSNIHYPDLAADFQFYLTRTPMVRMVLAGNVGMDESTTSNVRMGSNMPNPFNTTTMVPFALNSAGSVQFTVTDLSGRVVLVQDLGTRGAGEHQWMFDGSALASGTYTYTITTGSERLGRRMVIAR